MWLAAIARLDELENDVDHIVFQQTQTTVL
jgi:hypothetical protein